MPINANVTQIYDAKTTGVDELSVTSKQTDSQSSLSTNTAEVIWSYTSPAPETATKQFDLTALVGDDRGTISIETLYGMIIIVRSGTVFTVNPSSVTPNLLDEQVTSPAGSLNIEANCFVVNASDGSFATVTATNKILELGFQAAEADIVLWGTGEIS